MTRAWLVIDSGGTKTHFALVSPQGEWLQESYGAGIGRVVDEEFEPLDEFACQAKQAAGEAMVEKVVVNLGGKNEKQVKRVLSDCFPEAAVAVFRESGGVLADAMRARYGADAIVLLGTGAITIARGAHGLLIFDGWGANMGDVASGYWIGLEAIRRSLLELEGEKPLSSLAKMVTGMETPFSDEDTGEKVMQLRDQARAHIGMPLERARVASFCKVASACAQEGDESALNIFSDAGSGLGDTVIRALKKSGCIHHPRVLVIGGVARIAHLWGKAFEEKLKAAFSEASWESRDCDILEGAVIYAQNMKIGGKKA